MKLFNVIAASIFLLAPVPAIAQHETMTANVQNESRTVDITDSQVDAIYDLVGGKWQYDKMIAWAAENLTLEQIKTFDATIASGQYSRIVAAVEWLIQAHQAYSPTNSISKIVTTREKPAQTMSDTPFFWNR